MARVTIFEVGVRDGLQNEKKKVTTATKLWLTKGLIRSGVREIELGAFVRGDRVPAMADTKKIYAALASRSLNLGRARAWALVPNLRGLEDAIKAGAKGIAVFTAATDGFTRANIGMSVSESLKAYREVIREAKRNRIRVRGYVSTAFGCPFEGRVAPAKALRVVRKLAELGAEQVSIGDTIGVTTPGGVKKVVGPALRDLGVKKVAVHFHDTRGTALANSLQAFELGARTFDSSAGGLGGCPFAPGATGNLATEDLVYMFEGMGIQTGIDLKKMSALSLAMARKLGRPAASRYVRAWAAGSKGKHRW